MSSMNAKRVMNRLQFGQLVIGPPGSGKSTYCKTMYDILKEIGRKVAIINIDPANEIMPYEATVDIAELITVEDVMLHKNLGPNGSLIYCMEYLEKNISWLINHLKKLDDHYFIIDCPGQVELYTHHESMKKVMLQLQELNIRLCAVHLVDSHYCSDSGKFISTLLLSLTGMLQMELPHINVLSKIDQVAEYGDNLRFGLDFYTEVLDLDYLLEALQTDPFTAKYKKLSKAIVSLVEDYSLVSFLPLNIKDKKLIIRVKNACDKANGYVYGSGEERNVQALLASAVGAETEQERTGILQDLVNS
ncbi:GPN-loop GTPase 2 [Nilaparvata lugens]|uniref:GPN-loop GTPase 2 n=1 Tax=Nilaparvata lugens TaxID=108931 RepID=UPI000B9909AF|nr:GPN-loop GTPase 2 [Nilaparvata lugens]